MRKLTVGHWFAAFVIALALILLFGLASCKVKNKDKYKASEKLELSQVHSKITTESYKELVPLPADTAKAFVPWWMLQQGKTVTAQTNDAAVNLRFNPITGNIEAEGISKERTVPVQGTRKIEEHNKLDLKAEKKEKSSVVVTKSDDWGNVKLVLWLLAAAAAIYFAIRAYIKWYIPWKRGKWP
jgi:hypothetical protein